MERKLATVREVREILPIEGADRIELVKIDGWQCVAQKGEFKVGSRGVYFEVDSFLPIKPVFEFLRKACLKKMNEEEGFRLRTIKLKGQVSQGLLLPLSAFSEVGDVVVGDDLTEKIGVKLYEKPVPAQLSGTVRRTLPSWIHCTNQERVQNLTKEFDTLKQYTYEVTEKIDGTSMTVYFNAGDFGVCSHRMDIKEDDNNSLWKAAKSLKLNELLPKLNSNLALQGELAGESIQSNRLKLKGHTFFLFDIWDIDKQRYCTPQERKNIIAWFAQNGVELPHVPVLYTTNTINETIEQLIVTANGSSALNTECLREGLVFKCMNVIGTDVPSFKVINNEYLLKHDV